MIKTKKAKINETHTAIWIIVGVLAILTFLGITNINDLLEIFQKNNGDPFDVVITPDSINEGQYEKINFKVTVNTKPGRNITSLKLAKSNVLVDRENKNSQISVSKNIYWEKNYYNDNYVFYEESGYGSLGKLEAEGYLWGCDNCFMVEEFPYKFTFTFTYSEYGGEEKPLVLTKVIPIIG